METLDNEERLKSVEKPLQKKNFTGAVTFLDVLGWKGIWKENNNSSNEKPIDKLVSLLHKIDDKKGDCIKPYQLLLVDESEQGKPVEIKVLSISDTIVFFTPGPAKATLEVHASLCALVLVESLKLGLPLRGAISYGDYDYNGNIMIGPAVDEAASWHESTDWIGVVLTPSAKFALEGSLPRHVVEYDKIPFKKVVKGLNWCVDWQYENSIKELYKQFTAKGPHMQEVASKYLNTLLFLERNMKKDLPSKTNRSVRHFLRLYRRLKVKN